MFAGFNLPGNFDTKRFFSRRPSGRNKCPNCYQYFDRPKYKRVAAGQKVLKICPHCGYVIARGELKKIKFKTRRNGER